jgi:HD-GYP domain-containing protein (c-di-GMP phosphodiesterase class II)
LPRAAGTRPTVFAAQCEVGAMLCERLTIPAGVPPLLAHVFERWDGKGDVLHERGEAIPLPIRIAHVAHDADVQQRLGGVAHAARVIAGRAGGAFDPAVATCLVDEAADLMARDEATSAWDDALSAEPRPHGELCGGAIDGALAAMGDFADLPSPYLAGHASRVCRLAGDAAVRCGLDAGQQRAIRRAACVHDLGRVAVPVRIWQKPGPLTPDEWEKVRLHPYHLERLLRRSPFLAALTPVAGAHHERIDGSGYHRGVGASALSPSARVLAASDAYCAMVTARPHRPALDPERAAAALGDEASAGRLGAAAVAAVLETSGHAAPRVPLPAGLTEREAEVLGLLARGLQTKQVARRLGITPKTADHHVQHVYAKIGVSTRAGATLFAMQHGLAP